jgi:hypothetical protein
MDNPFYELPEEAMSRTANPQDVDRKIQEIRQARQPTAA